MTKPILPQGTLKQTARTSNGRVQAARRRKASRTPKNSDVLVSAVISTHLLTHLHQVLQKAEYVAVQEGRSSQAANYSQLRKVLCMDARSMEDAWASGMSEGDLDQVA